jgi:hypothetical protein
MNQIEILMALHHEAAEAAVDYVQKQMEPWHQQSVVNSGKQYMESTRQTLRAAIEQALKMEQLNYAGCMEDLQEAEKQPDPLERLTRVQEELGLYEQPCSPAEDGVCEALECCKDMDAFRLGYDKGADDTRRRDHERINDEALLRQALHALEYRGMSEWKVRQPAIAALKERLK